jgi:hypothetical protein
MQTMRARRSPRTVRAPTALGAQSGPEVEAAQGEEEDAVAGGVGEVAPQLPVRELPRRLAL